MVNVGISSSSKSPLPFLHSNSPHGIFLNLNPCMHADKEELGAMIQQLDERLNDKKEALLEKELILEEITGLSDRLRAQVWIRV